MKMAFVGGVHNNLDVMRGIGANTQGLIDGFKSLKPKDFQIVDIPKKADITHVTKFNPFFISIPFRKPSKKVILTIHDLIQLVYPKHYPPGIKGWIKFQINKFLLRKNVDRIITITETSKKDICRFLNVKPEVVEVIYIAPKKVIKKLKPGKWAEDTRKKFNLPKRFALFDHGVNYNKNIPTLIAACREAGMRLAIVGKETENIGKLDLDHPELAHLKSVDFSDVIKLGYVSDADLNKLFNLATVYVQPSFYEGFGMPVLEAMTVGCPVIASRTQALVEVAGDACIYFDPNDVHDLANKIKNIDSALVKKGFDRVKMFSWEKTARETLDVYKNL